MTLIKLALKLKRLECHNNVLPEEEDEAIACTFASAGTRCTGHQNPIGTTQIEARQTSASSLACRKE